MNIVDRLHSGLDAGVTRHWLYTKELLNIKPEYLMTVAVNDAVSLKQWFNIKKDIGISRKGKVDTEPSLILLLAWRRWLRHCISSGHCAFGRWLSSGALGWR